jgi:hypothetical protein
MKYYLTDSVFAKTVQMAINCLYYPSCSASNFHCAGNHGPNDMREDRSSGQFLYCLFVFSESIDGIIWVSMFKPEHRSAFLNAFWTLIPGVKAAGSFW